MTKNPKVSVIVPCYNCEKYLQKCLDSVDNQSFTDFEVICIDDGSTDKSINVLQKFQEKDSRFTIITQKNQGQSKARNVALAKATGNYICFLDADDYIDNNFLNDLYNAISENDADIVMTNTTYVNETNTSTHLKPASIRDFKSKIEVLSNGGACDKIYKRNLLIDNNIKFPDGLYWEDNLFIIEACFHSKLFLTINGANYNYINNPSGTTKDPQKKQRLINDSITILQKIMNFSELHALSKTELETVSDFCLHNFIDIKNFNREQFSITSNLLVHTDLFKKRKYKYIKKQIKKPLKDLLYKIFSIFKMEAI